MILSMSLEHGVWHLPEGLNLGLGWYLDKSKSGGEDEATSLISDTHQEYIVIDSL